MSNSVERRIEDRVSNIDGLDNDFKTVNHSLIVDISSGGAGILILKNREDISGNVCLNILQPDLSSLNGFNIDADVIWVDEEFSRDHRKVGVKFSKTDKDLSEHISQAVSWLGKKDHHFLRCEVTQY
ncbi:MAG: PilZ domain-containing protein [Gammaproteobacteria bacterium]|nr:PilZ domain-containing protein [Gammaproteobacteria bacterium]MCW8911593.1 PilZ domain-containing protein [Gammaproteobacteria bacterium]MCW9004293.1 PilZ domain-containing protein [Gammaproteobacteria bacterium]MCW9055541.1 PilZ domain-containing protein [Gammaproteobacteria bacterium]